MKKRSRQSVATTDREPSVAATVDDCAWLVVEGARHNNLKNIDAEFPLGRFVCVTGVSGSGKSSLVVDILREQLTRDLNGAESVSPGAHDRIVGLEHLDKVIDIDQTPIGRTPRSNPATYVKVFDEIRQLFARLPDSKVRGYKPGRFSFNVPTGEKGGGRCEACEGNGANKIEMDFLADVWVTCPVCAGRRFNHETLQIHYKGKSIYDVLDMDVQEALAHFDAVPKTQRMLATLHDVGLDYLKLGQSSTTLSGGEAQRIKLARELVKRSTGRTLYILDEPTTGLHFEDIRRLLAVLHGFVDAGNTVLVIEHNLDVIKTADWVIDLGPEGGAEGGRIVVAGTPEEVAACKASYTGASLKEMFDRVRGKATTTTRKKTRQGSDAKPSPVARHDEIVVVGAREHNLRDVSANIPRGRMTVCSGVSGSGKSSFAMDTVYTEGQRRYIESLSAYARQFLGQMQKPKVDHIHGLSPAIAIEQKSATKSPRSTVGTVTEIYDYMRVLWARVGQPYCPECNVPIGTQTSDEIVEKIVSQAEGSRWMLCAPIERGMGETWENLLKRCAAQGYVRARIDGKVRDLSEKPSVDARRRHVVELVVDRIIVQASGRRRIADSIEHCLAVGRGVMTAVRVEKDADASKKKRDAKETRTEWRFSQHLSCEQCGASYEELTPHHLSFNSRLGWCPSCEGLGIQRGTSPDSVIVKPRQSMLSGGIAGWEDAKKRPLLRAMIEALCAAIGFNADLPCEDLMPEQRHSLLFGLGEQWIAVSGKGVPAGLRFQWKGFFPAIDEATRNSWQYRAKLHELVTEVDCQACGGGRVRPESAAVRLKGKSIVDVCGMSLADAAAYFKSLRLERREVRIAGELLHEIKSRLRFLVDVGLGYLSLGRAAPTLSGGESQRIRLASQIGSGLTGVLYVLDEPTIGLHPRDNRRLIGALQKLRDLGNTLLMVEHDREVIEAADHLLDFGPGAGVGGGRIVASASPTKAKRINASLTGRYLAGTSAIAVPTNRRTVDSDDRQMRWLTVNGARQNNLKSIDVEFPLGRFVCVCGVSGSGKSSLVTEILHPALAARIHRARVTPGLHESIAGVDHVDKIINVDQEPIGNSPLSNPATYTSVFDVIREVYAKLPESKIRGYAANRFSFNRSGGRCDDCDGLGQVCHEMHFLPDVWVPCETCGGSRYQRETLEVRYKAKSIADVLNMSVAEALEHFENIPKVRRMLQTLADVGLDYLPLGQSAPTLSGGEAQRVKLAAELGRPNTGKTMYILDEPTTGLHFDDLRKLLDVLHRFVDMGNSVVCIEHNLDVIKTADWVLDLGPEAGDEGGRIVAAGTPEELAECSASHTGRLLKKTLADGPHAERPVFDAKKAAAKLRKERAKAEELAKDAPAVKMPWQRDGKRWHTEQRRSREGKEVAWEGAALLSVIEQIEKLGKGELQPTQWNDSARVEVTANPPQGLAKSSVPWFWHALTGGRWMLDLLFRVPRGAFNERQLAAQLRLKSLDEREDIPAYSQSRPVQMRNVPNDLAQVRVMVHDKKDVTTPAFKKFIAEALTAYLRHVQGMAGEADKGEPWKVDGRAWHLSQKCIDARQPKLWKPADLVAFIGLIKKNVPDATIRWDRKVFVVVETAKGKRVCKIITSFGQALRVDVHVPRGRFTPTQVEHLGTHQEFARQGSAGAELTFWFQSLSDLHTGLLAEVMRAAAE